MDTRPRGRRTVPDTFGKLLRLIRRVPRFVAIKGRLSSALYRERGNVGFFHLCTFSLKSIEVHRGPKWCPVFFFVFFLLLFLKQFAPPFRSNPNSKVENHCARWLWPHNPSGLHRFTNTSGVSCARSMKTTASSTSSSAAGAGTTGEEEIGTEIRYVYALRSRPATEQMRRSFSQIVSYFFYIYISTWHVFSR